jgi:hypothetical protein
MEMVEEKNYYQLKATRGLIIVTRGKNYSDSVKPLLSTQRILMPVLNYCRHRPRDQVDLHGRIRMHERLEDSKLKKELGAWLNLV